MNSGDYRLIRMSVISLLVLAAACMHKSPVKGTADDIKTAVIAQDSSGVPILLTLETVFQASSKSSGGGITMISGYEDLRLSAYDLGTGTMLARHVFGKRIKKGAALLGQAAGLVWVYSTDPQLGLHARDVRSLEVRVGENRLTQENPDLHSTLARPEWSRIDQFYGFDVQTNRLVVTDRSGFHWAVDPATLRAQRLSPDFSMSDLADHRTLLSRSGSFRGCFAFLKGEMRQRVEYDNHVLDSDLSFLDGKLLLDADPLRISLTLAEQEVSLREELVKFPERSPDQSERKKRMSVERALDQIVRMRESLQEGVGHLSSEPLLQPDPHSFLVLHRESTAPDAGLLISRLSLKGEWSLQSVWTVKPSYLFFDIGQARPTNSFKTVFSKGNPEFRFTFFDIAAGKLVLIHQLHACAIDLETGKLLWSFRF